VRLGNRVYTLLGVVHCTANGRKPAGKHEFIDIIMKPNQLRVTLMNLTVGLRELVDSQFLVRRR
jgi:hypothetical protein